MTLIGPNETLNNLVMVQLLDQSEQWIFCSPDFYGTNENAEFSPLFYHYLKNQDTEYCGHVNTFRPKRILNILYGTNQRTEYAGLVNTLRPIIGWSELTNSQDTCEIKTGEVFSVEECSEIREPHTPHSSYQHTNWVELKCTLEKTIIESAVK